MVNRFEWEIARRYLRAKRSDGFVSLVSTFSFLGIMLGLAALVLVSSMMNGFRADLERQLIGLNAHVEITRSDGELIKTDEETLATLRDWPGAFLVSLVARDEVILVSESGRTEAVTIRGVAPDELLQRGLVEVIGDQSQWQGWSLGISMQSLSRLGIRGGDRVEMISPLGNLSPLGWTPRMKRLPVDLVLDYYRDQPVAFLPLDKAQIFFRQKGGGSSVELFLLDPGQAREVRDAIRADLGEDYIVEDWMDLNQSLVTALDVERIVVVIILTLIVIVAAFSIVSSQVMVVRSKRRGIAILRTMGASLGAIARAFVLSGLSLGMVGAVFGLAIGLGIALGFRTLSNWSNDLPFALGDNPELQYLLSMPIHIQPMQIIAFGLFSLVVTVLATLYPAYRASGVSPIEALRGA